MREKTPTDRLKFVLYEEGGEIVQVIETQDRADIEGLLEESAGVPGENLDGALEVPIEWHYNGEWVEQGEAGSRVKGGKAKRNHYERKNARTEKSRNEKERKDALPEPKPEVPESPSVTLPDQDMP